MLRSAATSLCPRGAGPGCQCPAQNQHSRRQLGLGAGDRTGDRTGDTSKKNNSSQHMQVFCKPQVLQFQALQPVTATFPDFFPPPSPGQMLHVLSPNTTALSSSAAGEDHAWLALLGTREENPQLQGSPGACASDLCLARKPLELLWCLTDGRQNFAQAKPGIRAGTGNFFFLRAEEENKPSAHHRQPTPKAGITTRGHVHASSRRWRAWKTQRLLPGLSSAALLH